MRCVRPCIVMLENVRSVILLNDYGSFVHELRKHRAIMVAD